MNVGGEGVWRERGQRGADVGGEQPEEGRLVEGRRRGGRTLAAKEGGEPDGVRDEGFVGEEEGGDLGGEGGGHDGGLGR